MTKPYDAAGRCRRPLDDGRHRRLGRPVHARLRFHDQSDHRPRRQLAGRRLRHPESHHGHPGGRQLLGRRKDQRSGCRSASKRKSPADRWRIKEFLHHDRHRPSEIRRPSRRVLRFAPTTSTSTTMPIASTLGPRSMSTWMPWWEAEVGDNSLANKARNACRRLRDELEDQGLKHDEIFAQDRDTKMSIGFRYVARVGHRNDNHDVNEVRRTPHSMEAVAAELCRCPREMPQGSRPLRWPSRCPSPSRPAATILPWVSR